MREQLDNIKYQDVTNMSIEDFIVRYFRKDHLRDLVRKFPNFKQELIDIIQEELKTQGHAILLESDSVKGNYVRLIKT